MKPRLAAFITYIFCVAFYACTPKFGCRIGNCDNGQGTRTYPSGQYEGTWKSGKRNGQGTMTYVNGGRYKGTWKNDKRNGTGSYSRKKSLFSGSERYEGSWGNGKKNGQGTMTYENGGRYKGTWKNNKRDGQGAMKYINGNKYDGAWKNDKKHGQGIMMYKNGDKYDGVWKNNKRYGKGGYTHKIGIFRGANKYYGMWKSDKKHGQGSMTYANGNKYDGTWKNDKRDGVGIYTSSSGFFGDDDKYDGTWKNDKMSGSGTMTYANGGEYNGSWEDDKKYRYGIMTYKNGDVYDGQWNNSEKYGIGTMKYFNSDVYKGDWKNDKRHGQGTYTKNYLGWFDSDKKYTYIGGWKYDKKHGYGKMTFTDNISQKKDGMWIADVFKKDEIVVVEVEKPKKFKVNANYYALIIGNNKYQKLTNLITAENDAKEIEKVLKQEYGFKTNLLINASREDIIKKIYYYRKELSEDDNLLIYYAGHGSFDEEAGEGYWQPVDSDRSENIKWISNSYINKNIGAIHAKHIMIVADSCYSGKLIMRGVGGLRKKSEVPIISDKISRIVITSGGLEPVADGIGKMNHSVFASAFIEALQNNKDTMYATYLFGKVFDKVTSKLPQKPDFGSLDKVGHEAGGDFIFTRKNIHNKKIPHTMKHKKSSTLAAPCKKKIAPIPLMEIGYTC